MRRALVGVATAAMALLAAVQAPAQPRDSRLGQAPPGDYFQTCRNISSYGVGPDATMTAECPDRSGRWRQTSIRYASCARVDNDNGALACLQANGPPPPPFGPPPGDMGGDRQGRATITLFARPNFGGQPFFADHAVTNLPREFNDRAMSLRIDGRRAWMVCVNSDFQGRCEVFDHDVPDLRQYGMAGQISSMRPVR